MVHDDDLALSGAGLQVVKVKVCKLSVVGVCRNVVVKVSAGHVSVAVFLDFFDKLYHFGNVVGGLANHVGPEYVQAVDVAKKCVCVEFGDVQNRLLALLGGFEHFVLAVVSVAGQVADVGDVHHVLFFVA